MDMNLEDAKKALIELHGSFVRSDDLLYALVKKYIIAIEVILKKLVERECDQR